MQQVSLRVRLPPSAWELLNRRAALRETGLGVYADMILRYQLIERLHERGIRETQSAAKPSPAYDELPPPPPSTA